MTHRVYKCKQKCTILYSMVKYIAVGFALGWSLTIVLGQVHAFIAINAFGALDAVIHNRLLNRSGAGLRTECASVRFDSLSCLTQSL